MSAPRGSLRSGREALCGAGRRLVEPRRFAPPSRWCGRLVSGLLAVWVCVPVAVGEVTPQSFGGDPRIREVMYDPDEVVKLDGVVGYHLHLQFEQGETFVNLAAGDTAAIEVGSEGRHLMLKPRQASVATNLTIVTNRRVYTLEYSARSGREVRPAVYAVRFWYPQAPEEESDKAVTVIVNEAATRNREYWTCGAAELRPVEAFDDGVQTRLRFTTRGEWPAIFVATEEGGESLVNFHVEGDAAVLHRVARRFVLRRGERVACVENRAYAGGAARPPTGTVSEAIERVTRGQGEP